MPTLSKDERDYLNNIVGSFNKELESYFGSSVSVSDLSPEKISQFMKDSEKQVEVREIRRFIQDLVKSYLNNIRLITSKIDSFKVSVEDRVETNETEFDKLLDSVNQFEQELRQLDKTTSKLDHSHDTMYSELNHEHDYADKKHSHPDLISREDKLELDIIDLRNKKLDKDEVPKEVANHAKEHITGKDKIPLATESTRGLASPIHIQEIKKAVNLANSLSSQVKSFIVAGGSSSSGINSINDIDDVTITSASQGDIIYNNGTKWVNLSAGTNGYFLKTQGAGANPVWAASAGSGDMLASTYDPTAVEADVFDADNHVYSNLTSGLTASNVQAAIDEIDSDLDTHIAASTSVHGIADTSALITASGVTYENLSANSDIGTGATQVAQGNHTHSYIANVVEDTTPQLGGDLDLNAKGLTEELTAGENIANGDLCYMKSDSKMWKADASAATTATQFVAMCLDTITADSSGTFLILGKYTTSGLTAGSVYYISETAGAITATAPSTSLAIVRPIGTAISTTVLWFFPSNSWVEVA